MIRRKERLKGVHPALIAVIYRAIVLWTAGDVGRAVIITSGVRSREEQADLVKRGKSQTMNSYHLRGLAVDVALVIDTKNGVVTWDFDHYRDFNEHVQTACDEMSVIVTWGGEWTTLRDGPHFQLEALA